MNTRPISLLLIGHACHDLKDGAIVPGGTVTYAALMAKQLDQQVALLTSTGEDYKFQPLLKKNCDWLSIIPASHTTCFINKETEAGRIQYIIQKAADLLLQSASSIAFTPDLVLFGPIANEIDKNILNLFPHALKVACIQGWLRRWSNDGRVFTTALDASILKGLNIAIASDEDLRCWKDAIREILQWVPMLIVTAGAAGATVYSNEKIFYLPSYPAKPKETTGAGDIFALGFAMHYYRTKDPESSAIYAHSLASCHIEGEGLSNLPQPHTISNRLEQYRNFYREYIKNNTP